MALPDKLTVSDLFAHPEKLQALIDELIAIRKFQTVLEAPTGNNTLNRGKISLAGSAPNLLLRLPLQFTDPIADPLNNLTATNQAVKDILAEFRLSGINPTS